MSVPVRRQTHGKTRRRRSHHGLNAVTLADCPKCKEPVAPHHACAKCGYYDKKQVVSTERAAARAVKKAQAKSALVEAEEQAKKEETQAQVAEGKTAGKSK